MFQFYTFSKIYSQVFQSNELPSPKTLLRVGCNKLKVNFLLFLNILILKATAEANNLAAKAVAKEYYQRLMDQVKLKNIIIRMLNS